MIQILIDLVDIPTYNIWRGNLWDRLHFEIAICPVVEKKIEGTCGMTIKL